jgi:type I restriction enzyme M protein
MLTGELRNKIDKVWDSFWTGGVSNPLTVIEQITYLLFIRRLDEIHLLKENKANTLGEPIEKPIFNDSQQDLRWTRFKDFDPETMFDLMRRPETGIFDFMKGLASENGSTYAKYMKGATFMIPTPNLLEKVVTMLSDIDMHDRDTKGDLYEYLLSKIASAGKNGQFRTPRHIIKMMVAMTKPTPEDIICDPAAGTCGFLVAAGEYMHENHKEIFHNKAQKEHYNNNMFFGNEFDATMIRIGAMNMLLHGIESPNLDDKDSLSESNQALSEQFTLVLANPPFKGSLDYDSVEKSLLKVVKTKKTELLFLALMLRALQTGGRCAVIVPDGVLFGSSNAHKDIRKELIDNQKLQAIISMPSGVFKPYAGVSTAVLLFTKTESGGTDNVWFYDMKADGYSLDDKRNPIETNDIPDILSRWDELETELARKRTEQSFFVPVNEIRENNYDLSINRYKEIVYEEVKYDPPKKIIAEIRELQSKKTDLLSKLENLLNS